MAARFELLSASGAARRGRLSTAHGEIETPAFMPVGTLGAVKGVSPMQLAEAGASVMLANLYHLSLRPGVEVIEELGGLHEFCGWDGPILTDSGGYQVFSLARLRSVDRDGVRFRSHVDGQLLELTPEKVVDLQRRLGVDLAMVLDECPPWPVDEAEAERSLDRTNHWARRSREAWRGDGALLGIVQGSVYPRLRERAATELIALDFDGYAIGGVSVGEGQPHKRRVVELTAPSLPADKVRYLMGVGTPAELFHAVSHGVDLFDCVLPSRNARHGLLYTSQGPLRIKNARFRRDPGPVDEACGCPTCAQISRAFLHHLIRTGEITGRVLATLHNLRFYLDFMGHLRKAIASGHLEDLAADPALGSGERTEEPAPSTTGSAIPTSHLE